MELRERLMAAIGRLETNQEVLSKTAEQLVKRRAQKHSQRAHSLRRVDDSLGLMCDTIRNMQDTLAKLPSSDVSPGDLTAHALDAEESPSSTMRRDGPPDNDSPVSWASRESIFQSPVARASTFYLGQLKPQAGNADDREYRPHTSKEFNG
mmetsp:Transcript_8962/g.15354  ORF Transcript_8962/g.15354 Transcript_8962/m.15354 type:complete len:151 (-) Transcript_8962:2-454(-)